MKRFAMYGAAAVLALLLTPAAKRDVGDLLPVELLYIYNEMDGVHVEADTGHMGIGRTLDAALGDLKASAPGEVFLETADYLVIDPNAVALLPQLWHRLRPATEVCIGAYGDAGTAEFLAAHKPGVNLNDIRSGRSRLPVLIRTEERYHLESQ